MKNNYINRDMRILITGATGVIGKRLVEKMASSGYTVAGLTTTKEGASFLNSYNAKSYVGDIFDRDFIFSMVSDFKPNIIIHQITDLKNMSGKDNSQIRKIGTKNLVEAALKNNVDKMISQSIAWVYEGGNSIATEEVSLDINSQDPRKITIEGIQTLEEETRKMPEYVILRYGTLYGPDTWYGKQGAIYNQFKNGEALLSEGTISFIHVDDAVEATIQSISWPNGVYNVVDDEPIKGDVWASYYAKKLNVNVPTNITSANPWERGASNRKFKDAGGTLSFSSWRKGMEILD